MENALLLGTDLNNHKVQVDASMEKKWYQCKKNGTEDLSFYFWDRAYYISLMVIVMIKWGSQYKGPDYKCLLSYILFFSE